MAVMDHTIGSDTIHVAEQDAAIITCHSEHADVYSMMCGRKSLCTGSGLKGFGDFVNLHDGGVPEVGLVVWSEGFCGAN